MSDLAKRIEAEIKAGTCTDVPSVNDDIMLNATRYGIRIDYKASGETRYVPPNTITPGLSHRTTLARGQLALFEEELRMYERAESEVEKWQAAGEQGNE